MTSAGRAIGIGYQAQQVGCASGIGVGDRAGNLFQGIHTIAIGSVAGNSTQGEYAIAIGRLAGQVLQGSQAISIGFGAGQTNQGSQSVALGYNAGQTNQGFNAVAVGYQAGAISQGAYGVHVGVNAGMTNSTTGAVGIGFQAGGANQSNYAIAIGFNAALTAQGQYAIAIGNEAGRNVQKDNAVAIGRFAGQTNQGTACVAIGYLAGRTNQGANSIAINSTGADVETPNTSSFYVKPISIDPAPSANWAYTCYYNRVAYNAITNPGAFSIANFTVSLKSNKVIVGEFDDTSSILDLQMYRYYYKNEVETQSIEIGYMADDVYAIDENLACVDSNNELHGVNRDRMLFFAINELKKLRKEFDEYKDSHP
jgi:hypothetical protein